MAKPRLYHAPELAAAAARYAAFCELEPCAETPALSAGYALLLDHSGMALLAPDHAKPFRLDAAELVRRRAGLSLLARACDAGTGRSVLDPFAGFGLDALLLAAHGCKVTTVEQQVAPYLMSLDLAARAGLTVTANLGDAWDWLTGQRRWDIVYLDPMFPARNKRALPNRGLQHLRDLAGAGSQDLAALLAAAQTSANLRVVLKRRRTDPLVGKPHHQLQGRSVRFDVYA